MGIFGWDLPPGCTTGDIERAFGGGDDDSICAFCQSALPDPKDSDEWQFDGCCDAICAAEYGLLAARFDNAVWSKSAQDDFRRAIKAVIEIAKKAT